MEEEPLEHVHNHQVRAGVSSLSIEIPVFFHWLFLAVSNKLKPVLRIQDTAAVQKWPRGL